MKLVLVKTGNGERCCVKPDELVTLIKKDSCDKIRYVKFKTTDGSEVSHKTYSFEAKLKDCYVPIKFVAVSPFS